MKKTHALADLNMIGRRLFDSELMENIFYQQATIFEILM